MDYRKGGVLSGYTYTLEFDKETKRFSVKPEPVRLSAARIVKETPFHPTKYELEDIPDTFNDKLDFTSVQTFERVAELNRRMLPVAKKYELFGGSEPSLAVLQKFHHNFIGIQTYLGCIQEKLVDSVPCRSTA
eukprot:GDKI01006811.1.p1 GENE.GDKI01006811.1~~GDKI01006811.1.p1  ORF type:complete len:133 (-),score=34.96 GDKI01006811.1:37-435(-)